MKISRYEAAGLKCVEVAPENCEDRNLPLVIIMHGRGDWGESYVGFADMISMDNYRFIFPTAPLPLPGAYFEWFRFDQSNLGGNTAGARPVVTALLDDLRQRYQMPANKIVLGGFSQGGMMTLEVGLRYPEKLAGLVALSSFLVANAPFNWLSPGSTQEYYLNDQGDLEAVVNEAGKRKVPIFIGHGTYDSVVPVLAGRATRDLLKQAGALVEYYEFPGDHEISMEELEEINAFLAKVLSTSTL
ncbi:MAG TPA: alpha/beta fold hydrolase [Chloroflexia bacterium]|nr:alpha/beta fold hydrolase [Chloroflexia bacterium]